MPALLVELEQLYIAQGFTLYAKRRDKVTRVVLKKDDRYIELLEQRPLGKISVIVREM
jgi:hypothetical protein